jgi:hypothetical protein
MVQNDLTKNNLRMKYAIYKSACIAAAILIAGCGTNQDNTSGGIDLSGTISEAKLRRGADRGESGGNKCLLGYQDKYDQLLTADMVLQATGFAKSNLTVKYNKVMGPENHEVVYRFKNNRMGKIAGIKREMQVPDIVALRSIKPLSLDEFAQRYKALTAEQEQAARQSIDDVAEGRSGDADADAHMKQLKKKGLDEQSVKGASNQMVDGFKKIGAAWTEVTGLGDAARFNTETFELVVLSKGVQFAIRAEISNDITRNKDLSLALARQVLEQCK